jgi:putative Mg2+ transporter-C (MgtC) family protein
MDSAFGSVLARYWSAPEVAINVLVFLNLLGALLLGFLVGYERSYRGRAAGMRTYGIVCMASCALTVMMGYPGYWFGGHSLVTLPASGIPDPTRVIQGIVTGVGFIGAGVIMKEGLNISGLTTAASLWAASAIGVMVGLGFYAAAMLLSVLSALCMMWASSLERWLPARTGFVVVLRFERGFVPKQEELVEAALRRGYEMALGSLSISLVDGRAEWRFTATSLGKGRAVSLAQLSDELRNFAGVESFDLSPSRN